MALAEGDEAPVRNGAWTDGPELYYVSNLLAATYGLSAERTWSTEPRQLVGWFDISRRLAYRKGLARLVICLGIP